MTEDNPPYEPPIQASIVKIDPNIESGTQKLYIEDVSTPIETEGLNFENTEIAFQYKSDADLKKSELLFSSLKFGGLVRIGEPALMLAFNLGLPVKGVVDRYFFSQFCGGKSLQDALPRIEMLYSYGVRSILDYAVEAQQSDVGYNNCVQETLKGIAFAKDRPEVEFIAIKITGLGNFDILQKAQEGQLTAYEKAQYDKIVERLDTLCAAAAEARQSLLIDAEETWIQDAVDRMAEDMIYKYNKEYPAVYTTVQMYRNDRLEYVKELFMSVRRRRAIPAVKLVRGAYLEKENQRAQKMGYPTPLNLTKMQTDVKFNKALLYILERLDKYAICAGTHNEQSCMLGADYINEHKIDPQHPNLSFSQLFGMSDHITFNMAKHGFRVGKYLPYGPLDAVMPYLMRRAKENSSIAGQSSRELKLIETELHRRSIAHALGGNQMPNRRKMKFGKDAGKRKK